MKLDNSNSIEISTEEVQLILSTVTTPHALKTIVALAVLAVVALVAFLYFGKPGV